MRDFDFDNNMDIVNDWKKRYEKVGIDPNDIYNLVGATYRDIEGAVTAAENRGRV